MSKPNDGGPASEKSLRDDIAIKAMQLAYSEDMTFEQMAEWSHDYADAMIAEGEKRATGTGKPWHEFDKDCRVRVRADADSPLRGSVGTVKVVHGPKRTGWEYDVQIDGEPSPHLTRWKEGELEAVEDEKVEPVGPKFKKGDRVRINSDLNTGYQTGIVEAVHREPGKVLKYDIHLEKPHSFLSQGWVESELEAAGEGE